MADCDRYIKNCKLLDLDIDPGVVIALKTRWHIMQPTKKLSEGGLLPLMDILNRNDHISKLNLASAAMKDDKFRSAGNGNTNARVLNLILQENSVLNEVDLQDTGLDDDGLHEICAALQKNKSVTNLNLARNHFSSNGAENLHQALSNNSTLKFLDLSRNALGYQSINKLQCVCGPKGIQLNIMGNFVFEEVLNSVSHGVGFLLSVIGAILLMSESCANNRTEYHFWACFVFSFSLIFLFLSSTLYHSFFMLPHGSYTPFLLITLHEYLSARVLLIVMWLAAITGAVYSACSDLNAPATGRVELLFYLILGFACVPVWNIFSAALSPPAVVLVILMGLAYVVGIVFFIWGNSKPIYHSVWHLFVMLGATLTWFNVYFFVVNAKIDVTKIW